MERGVEEKYRQTRKEGIYEDMYRMYAADKEAAVTDRASGAQREVRRRAAEREGDFILTDRKVRL